MTMREAHACKPEEEDIHAPYNHQRYKMIIKKSQRFVPYHHYMILAITVLVAFCNPCRTVVDAWSTFNRRSSSHTGHHIRLGRPLSSFATADNADGDPVRLLVLDTMVPGQRLYFAAENDKEDCVDEGDRNTLFSSSTTSTNDLITPPKYFIDRLLLEYYNDPPEQEIRTAHGTTTPPKQQKQQPPPIPLVVVGRQGLSLHSRGVEVFVEKNENDKIETTSIALAATGRIGDICNEGQDEGSRWKGRAGNVHWLSSLHENDMALSPNPEPESELEPQQLDTERGEYVETDNETQIQTKTRELSTTLESLVEEWDTLVRTTNRERFPGHLDSIRQDLGPLPKADKPNERALWVSGLINPLPALGVAIEIRPAVLTARTTSRRLIMAEYGIRDSIDRLRRPGPCF